MVETKPFEGPDRIAIWELTGHPMRMGDLKELAVSDKDRIEAAIDRGDFDDAKTRFQLFYGVQTAIVTTFLEWNYAIPATLKALKDVELPDVVESVTKKWLKSSKTLVLGEIYQCLANILAPESINCDSVTALRDELAKGRAKDLEKLFAFAAEEQNKALEALEQSDKVAALTHIRRTTDLMRSAHDSLGLYNWAWIAGINEAFGQDLAAQVMHESFESCSFIAGLWGLVANVSPADLAAFLADHLRTGHLSGPGRGGAVTITESEDSYRLDMDACGTGGALRRGLKSREGLGFFETASPATWGRTGEVPAYCAHCAQNEIESIKRFGYPAWVTDFNPDPEKSCAWIIYKDSKTIPKEYYERVGAAKPMDV
ncbi:MAG: hypothetical protein P1V97_33780 [Planctomycetota bacterium]|nr:hypothetical protein [Planctomycetota bacterium]